jgi:hypothetical protein
MIEQIARTVQTFIQPKSGRLKATPATSSCRDSILSSGISTRDLQYDALALSPHVRTPFTVPRISSKNGRSAGSCDQERRSRPSMYFPRSSGITGRRLPHSCPMTSNDVTEPEKPAKPATIVNKMKPNGQTSTFGVHSAYPTNRSDVT